MQHTALLAIGLAALSGGCKKKSDDAAGSAASAGSGTAAGPGARLEPFTGKLTVDRVMGARDLVRPFDPWDDGFAKLQALVGKPTKIEGPRHTWAIVEGDACAHFYVTRDNGADYKMEGIIVGTVQSPAQSTTDGATGNHAECLKAAGVDLGPPEDPAALGPPAAGTAIDLAGVRSAVIPGRSKWKDHKVKVAATLGAVSTSTSGQDTYVTVNLTAGADDTAEPLSCSFEKNAAAPDLAPGTAVIASGTMKIQEWTSMGTGVVTLKPGLSDCTIAAAPAK